MPTLINKENYMVGNNAMAAALLLYYHLTVSGGFSGDETVYIDPSLFNGFAFIDVEIKDSITHEIDQDFLRKAAVIYLLCDLNDVLTEFSESFHSFDTTRKISAELSRNAIAVMPEIEQLLKLLETRESDFDFDEYSTLMDEIFNRHVAAKLRTLNHQHRRTA